MTFPFFKDLVIDLGPFFILLAVLVIAGAGNAVNLTDGLDGLAIVPVMIAAATFGVIAYLSGNAKFAGYLQIHHVPGTGELAVICGALIGAGLGFLWFNAPPAMIFMGDTGSLALGGTLGAIAVAIKHEIVLAVVGGLFVLETLSVIIQVLSFKWTGKRVFKMAPLHHHYRAEGLEGIDRRHPLLDHLRHSGADRPFDAEVALARQAKDATCDKFLSIIRATSFMANPSPCSASVAPGSRPRVRCATAGASVTGWDDGAAGTRGRDRREIFRCRSREPTGREFSRAVLAPGVPLTHPEPHWTVSEGAGERRRDHRRHRDFRARTCSLAPSAPFIAVTGTNGKSTTTALIAHILRHTGRDEGSTRRV